MKGLSTEAALRSALLTGFFVIALAWIGDSKRGKTMPGHAAFAGGVEMPVRRAPDPERDRARPATVEPRREALEATLDRALRRGLSATTDGDAAGALRARDQLAERAPTDRRLYELERAIVAGFRPILAAHLAAGRCSEAQALYRSLEARGLAERADELFGDNRCPLPR